MTYEFTEDWFSMRIPIWEQIVSQLSPRRILEIGSYEGRSTCWMIENCKHNDGLEMHCVDIWDIDPNLQGKEMSKAEERFDNNINVAMKKAGTPAKIVKHKKKSAVALSEFLVDINYKRVEPFDLIYIDGSHTAPDVLSDAVMSFHVVKPGGMIIFDDYLWQNEQPGLQNAYNMPKPAIDAFMNIYQRKMRIVEAPLYQIYAVKTSEN